MLPTSNEQVKEPRFMMITHDDIILRGGRRSAPRKPAMLGGIARTFVPLIANVWPRGREASVR